MVKIASIALFTLFAGAVVAQPHMNPRESVDENAIEARGFDNLDNVIVTREDLETIFGREYIEDLEARDPFGLGLLFKGIKGIAKLAKHGHHAHSSNDNHNHRREFEEEEDLVIRDIDELAERDPFGLGLLFKGIKGIAKLAKHGHHAHSSNDNHNHRREFEDEEDLVARDIDELDEREPFGLGLLFKGIKGIAKLAKHGHHAHSSGDNHNHRREFEDDSEILEREDMEDEMLEREVDEEDLLEREYYDDLD